jgi:hypothetical protein
VGNVLVEVFRMPGLAAEVVERARFAPHLVFRSAGRADAEPVGLFGHLDTVFRPTRWSLAAAAAARATSSSSWTRWCPAPRRWQTLCWAAQAKRRQSCNLREMTPRRLGRRRLKPTSC